MVCIEKSQNTYQKRDMPLDQKKKSPGHRNGSSNRGLKKKITAVEDEAVTEDEPTDVVDAVEDEAEVLDITEEEADITSIYDLDEEGPVDMTKMEKKNNRGKWVAITTVIVLLLAAAGYFGYRVFTHDFSSGNGEVALAMTVDEKVASGDVVTIEVEYQNNQKVDIAEGEIELFYPKGFQFQSASTEPDDDRQKIWKIENVQPGAGGRIRIVGQLVGDKDENKEFSALLTYQPENFSQRFQETASATTTITSSIISVTTELPTQTQSDTEFEYKVTFKNTSKAALNNVQAVIQYPDGFTVISTDPEADRDNTQWRFSTLEPNQSETISVKGSAQGKSGKTKEFIFQLGVLEVDNSFNVQVEKSSLVVIVNPELDLSLETPQVVDQGAEVPVIVNITNASEAVVKNLKIKLELSSGFKEEEYTFEVIPELAPFEDVQLTASIGLKKGANGGKQTVKAIVDSASVEGKSVAFPNTATAEVVVRGEFTTSAEGRYFDDDLTKIGSGPLPPVVNNETTYVIRWKIRNGSNELKDFSMTTTLPETVIWNEDASEGVEYNSATRQVSYTVPSIEENTELTLDFSVRVAPTNDDLNKLLVLTGETVVSAVDTVTKERVDRTLERITTDLPNDEGAKGKGVVEGS